LRINLFLTIIMIPLLFYSNSNTSESTPTVKEGYIEVTGGRVWYRIVGAEKEGIPLLTLHGGPGAPHDYFEPLEELADERPVIFYDQLGCGNSDKPSDTTLWTTGRFVEEVELVRKALELDTVHILGQSWGTMLATEYMIRKNPGGVVSLILSGPYLSTQRWVADQKLLISKLPQSVQDTINKYEANGDFASSSYQEAMMHFYKKYLCRLDPWPECLNRSMEKMGVEVYNYMWGPSEFTMTGTLKDADLSEKLNLIKAPVLFTCGEFDEATPTTTTYYQSKVPGSEIHIFQGASHSHHLEKREEYLQVVRDYIRKTEAK